MGDLLSPNNVCGQNLLRIVSRGSAIIAELLRLASNIPECFLPPDRIKDPEQLKYAPILFDYQYLRDADECEKKVNESQELLDIDQEFQENFEEILGRFFMLFQSVWKFQADFNKFIEDVQVGYYIQHSLESIVDETAGKQLLSEALYHYGMMMLFMEEKIPGVIRERLLIAHYRLTGGVGIENLDEIFKLWRNTGYVPNAEGKRPKNHPESLFARFPPPKDVVRLVIGHLQTDDVYLMNPAFPDPDHRSTRLANQAGMLYVILYFSPDTLHKQKGTMREIVDKYFNDNWVIATYMGQIVDLFVEWAPYAAAKAALDNVLNATQVKTLAEANAKLAKKCERDLQNYLREGILQQEYILDNIKPLLHCMRNCNIALRWRLLHRKTRVEVFRKILLDPASPMQAHEIVALLLNTSQFEFLLKEVLQALLAEKDAAWTTGKDSVADRLTELSEYFTGEKALTRVKRDEPLMQYFAQLSQQVRNLNLDEGNATGTGRTIKSLIAALDDVEQFESLDTNIQIKSFIAEIREIFLTMIRTVNIKNEVLHLMETISDLSYAWQILVDYIPIFHERISKDPGSVTFLRATFLKAASMLDVPLVRITAIDSPDAVSVAEYYSGELVEFVRIVLEIIPKSIFTILSQIVTIQTAQMQALPIRFEAKDLKEFAQLDTRFEVAKLTYRISTFTEGILLMERTLLGVIQVDPRHILEEGLRRELVRLVSIAMNKYLTFPEMSMKEINENMQRVARTLDGLKKSIEYLQDYIGIAGLKIFMQEFFRIVNYNIEQESNRFVKKKTLDSSSRYQSKAIPIPRLLTANAAVEGEEFGAMTFMGRVMAALLALTDPTRTIYASECAAWFEHPAPDVQAAARKKDSLVTVEVCGARTFQLLERSIGAIGLRGLDRLVAFRTVHALNAFIKFYGTQVHPFRTMLDQIRGALFPEYKIPPNATKLYVNAIKKLENLFLPMLKIVRRLGQGQLLRRQIANSLQLGCQLEAHHLFQALDTFNIALVSELRNPAMNQVLVQDAAAKTLCYETAILIESCGLDDPLAKVYVTSAPLEGLPVMIFLFILAYLPKLEYDANFGALVRRKAKFPLDGVPMVVGLACLLRQFHPSYTRKVLAYLGQFVRASLSEAFADVDNKAEEVPRDVLNVLVFLEQLCKHTGTPRQLVYDFVPAYIFDALSFATAKK